MALTPEDMAWVQQQMQQRQCAGGQMALPGATPNAQAGMMGFGDIKSDPGANQAAQDIAGTTDDALGGDLMVGSGSNIAASGHGVMSPFEAAANGLKTAVGMGMIGQNMSAKKNAIKSLLRKPKADPFDSTNDTLADAPAMSESDAAEGGV